MDLGEQKPQFILIICSLKPITTMITIDHLTRIKHDTFGNPRYVIHFSDLLTNKDRENLSLSVSPTFKVIDNLDARYKLALKKAKALGGRKFHNKQYGGGIVFQSYNTTDLVKHLNELLK